MVIFNKDRFKRIKGVAGSAGRRIVKRKRFKKLSVKNEHIAPPVRNSTNTAYEASKIIYTRNSNMWRWMRMSHWFKELENHELSGKNYLIKK